MARGIIYILTNEAMEGYVKIGKTSNNVEERMRQLDTTSVPLPFECYHASEVEDMDRAEKLLHDTFDDIRTRPRREFFEIAPERVRSALRLAEVADVTPRGEVVEDADDTRALEKAHKQRSRFNFSLISIDPGTILQHRKDPNITCEVFNDREVIYNGERTSLSKASLDAYHSLGYDWNTVSGPETWMHEGKSLMLHRKEIEYGEG